MTFVEIMEKARAYVAEEKPKIQGPEDAANVMRPLLHEKPQEEFWVLMLNTKHTVTAMHCVTVGLLDRSQVHAREVFRQAITDNCSRIVLCHNHPSGDPTPSAQDISCTRDLVAAGKIVGIEVLDHVVIGCRTPSRPKDFLSFREENLL